mmetsp:Transcript_39203/g.117885  ORF Transcript_39203/g.117885 Transcript_39203/m.117885 type:complete len:198 (+) Transcript_39203:708-1301(+)
MTSFERGKTSLGCLVPSCEATFLCDVERQSHLNCVHGYPKWFRFHPRPRRLLESANKEMERKRQIWQEKRKKKLSEFEASAHNMLANSVGQLYQSSKSDSMAEKKRERRERQKKSRATIPCKFFSKESGCWRGNKCMFLHEVHSTTNRVDQLGSPDVATETMELVDELADTLQAKVSLSVPNNAGFGRRRGKALARR